MFIDTYWGKIILWSMHVRGTMHADDRMQEQWSMHAWIMDGLLDRVCLHRYGFD
jgi:hypothetical protein